jgi:hypothetical protein
MSIYWLDGRSYFAPNAGLGVRTGRNEPCERAAQENRSENQPLCTKYRLRRTRLFGG